MSTMSRTRSLPPGSGSVQACSLGTTGRGAVVVEDRAGDVDAADAVEVDGHRVLCGVASVGVDGDDGAKGAFADVRLPVSVDVEVAVRCPSGHPISDSEGPVAAGGDGVAVEFVVDSSQEVG